MDRLDAHASLGHHVACNGRIDTAREQQKSRAVRANGHTARALELACMHVSGILTHLNLDHDLGIMHVHADGLTAGQQNAANLHGDLHGILAEGLIRTLALYLEGALAGQKLRNIFTRGGHNAFHILFANGRSADCNDTKGLSCRFEHAVHIAKFILGLNINGALRAIDIKITVIGGTTAQFAAKHVLKIALVCALEHDLAVFTKQYFLHFSSPRHPRRIQPLRQAELQ